MRNEWDVTSGSEAVAYFYDEVIGMSALGKDNKLTRIVLVNVIHLGLTQAIIESFVSFGIKWTGRIGGSLYSCLLSNISCMMRLACAALYFFTLLSDH
eukprot:5528086-Ditylum_brightwellii.AAC.1